MRTASLIGISVLFILWGLGFIYRSSVLAIDGRRYFSLIDDAMISMRYAWNMTHGNGLVWNPGERIEGYSNLLMVLLMAVPAAFLDKSNAVLVVQLAAIGMMLGTAFLTMKIARLTMPATTSSTADLVEVLAFAAPLLYYPLAFWALMGMETGLLALLLSWAVLASLRYARGLAATTIHLGIALGLAYLTRNDSLIFAIVIFGFLGGTGKGTPSERLRALIPAVGICALFIAGQAAFRYSYYGNLLPNTYLLKLVGMPLRARIENGAGFVAPFVAEMAVLLVAAALGTIWRPSLLKYYLGAFLLAALTYELYVGGDYSNYWRIMAPAVPMVLLILIHCLSEIIEKPGHQSSSPTHKKEAGRGIAFRPAAAVVVAVLLVAASTNRRFVDEILLPRSLTEMSRDYVDLAVAINAATQPGATVGVIRAGVIPYYTGRIAVDFLGKNDPYIAQLPPDLSGQISWNGMYSVSGHNKYDLEYSIQRRLPTYVEGFEWGGQNLNEWSGAHYTAVKYDRVRLNLLRLSPLVNWDAVKLMNREQERSDPPGN